MALTLMNRLFGFNWNTPKQKQPRPIGTGPTTAGDPTINPPAKAPKPPGGTLLTGAPQPPRSTLLGQ